MTAIPPRRSAQQQTVTKQTMADIDEDDSYYTSNSGRSAIRYQQLTTPPGEPRQTDSRGRVVIRQGNRQFVMVPLHEAGRTRRFHWSLFLGLGMLLALTLWITGALMVNHWQAVQQQQAFNTPPVTEQFQVVGHNNDSATNPSFFMFINLRGTVEIVELPAGDASKALIYIGPRILGDNVYTQQITATFADMHGDGKVDMVVQVGTQTITYLNNGTKFVPPGS